MIMKKPILSKFMVISTIAIAVLSMAASLLGLFTNWPYAYETENWRQQAWGQDIGNLLAIIPLVVGLVTAMRGSQRGFFVWIGSLFYFLYAYFVYAVSVHFGALFPVYVVLLGLALYTLIFALPSLPSPRIDAAGARKFAGGVLLGTGIMFALLWMSEIIPAIMAGDVPKSLVEAGLVSNPVYVIDLAAVLPAFILSGYWCLKNTRIGLSYVAPWLMFSILMGASIVAAMIVIAQTAGAAAFPPMIMVGTVVVLCTVALVRYLRVVH